MTSAKRFTGNVSPSPKSDKPTRVMPTSVLFKNPDDLRAVRIAAAANGMTQQDYIVSTSSAAAREFCAQANIDLTQFEQPEQAA